MMRLAPFSNEYGYLHMSHVFFLLCASHVFKLQADKQSVQVDATAPHEDGAHQS